jgi:fructoselysine-6-P-deglycase FrlB-like protein
VKGFIPYAQARATQADELEKAIERVSAQVKDVSGPGPIFVGIGNSLAAAGAAVWRLRERGIEAWRAGAGDHPVPFPHSIHPLIGVSQSGRSAETLAVLAEATDRRRMAVVNTADSPIARTAGRVLHLGDIPDSYASTIGYTATVAALGLLADAWDGGAIDPGWAALPDLCRGLDALLKDRMREVVAGLGADAAYADVVGAAPARGSAECGALLLREVARLAGTPMSTREYLHGAMESAGTGLHVLLGDDREVGVADTLAAAGHRVLLVTAAPVASAENLWTIPVADVPAAQRAVLDSLVMQSLAEALAHARGVEIEEFVFHHDDTKVATPSA